MTSLLQKKKNTCKSSGKIRENSFFCHIGRVMKNVKDFLYNYYSHGEKIYFTELLFSFILESVGDKFPNNEYLDLCSQNDDSKTNRFCEFSRQNIAIISSGIQYMINNEYRKILRPAKYYSARRKKCH